MWKAPPEIPSTTDGQSPSFTFTSLSYLVYQPQLSLSW